MVWGDSSEEAYRRTIEVINRAAAFINARTADQPRFGGTAASAGRLDERARSSLLRSILPVRRSRGGRPSSGSAPV